MLRYKQNVSKKQSMMFTSKTYNNNYQMKIRQKKPGGI